MMVVVHGGCLRPVTIHIILRTHATFRKQSIHTTTAILLEYFHYALIT